MLIELATLMIELQLEQSLSFLILIQYLRTPESNELLCHCCYCWVAVGTFYSYWVMHNCSVLNINLQCQYWCYKYMCKSGFPFSNIVIDYQFVRDLIKISQLRVSRVSSWDQLADALTKPLPRNRFTLLMDKIDVVNHPPSRGSVLGIFVYIYPTSD